MAPAEAVIQMTDEEFQQQTLALIKREFGLPGLTRFIRLNYSGRGDYTRDRHLWLDGVTLEDIERDLAALQTRQDHPQ